MSNEIILGDCYELLKQIKSSSVDLILTDPPYNISRSSNFKKNSDNKKFNNISIDFGDWDQNERDLDKLFFEFKRILKKGGTLIIFYDIWKSQNIKYFADLHGFKQPRVCQWVKTNPVPINSKKNYLSNAIEFFFTFVKGGKSTFNSSYDKGLYNYPICHGKERTEHPTQKPLGLIKSIIEKHSNVGDLVLDPFGGSGTTAIAAIELSRDFILFEKDQSYFELSKNRIEQIKK
jgi:DNA modification methylase